MVPEPSVEDTISILRWEEVHSMFPNKVDSMFPNKVDSMFPKVDSMFLKVDSMFPIVDSMFPKPFLRAPLPARPGTRGLSPLDHEVQLIHSRSVTLVYYSMSVVLQKCHCNKTTLP
jgi:hypothetical protein